ncbi:MAG: hypothetical protein NTY03_13500 [Candidatus Bathyarchaeota archaeon]|nr:hypothetical protein [Candidatus Bathyarchaeota archaeon]
MREGASAALNMQLLTPLDAVILGSARSYKYRLILTTNQKAALLEQL